MIKQAIIPLAGLGTRMLPLTSVMPKELMPINGKPNLQYILEECIDAGVKEFIFIISTGDAVLKCQKYIKSKYFLMLLPDDLIIRNNCSKEMIRLHKKINGSIIATKRVERKTVSRWGILSIKNKKKRYFQIKDVIEKPSIKKAPSNFAIIGRYILPTKIFGEIKKLKPGQGGEIHITDAIRSLIKKGNKFYGNIFTGKYLDCGTLSGYINSGIQISKRK